MNIVTKDETFSVRGSVLTGTSEYFATCLNTQFSEATDQTIAFSDIESKYLAYYLGLAHSYSSIAPHIPPHPAKNPEVKSSRTPLRDYIEVYKLCDRFISPEMGAFMISCIKTTIGDGHRALFRSESDEGLQRILMRDFADGHEALELEHTKQTEIGECLINYFCEGIHYGTWISAVGDLANCPRFVASVSGGFAKKLAEVLATGTSKAKSKRKELSGPE